MNKNQTASWFEQHPTLTMSVVLLVVLFGFYGLVSIRWINNAYTENQKKSIKTIVHQYLARRIIDNNVGRFILLREYPPNQVKFDRPSRNYVNNISGTLERQYYRIETDENGFILPSGQYADPDVKVVFLGGSTTECFYMEEANRFPAVVSQRLSEQLHKKVNTYNGGRSANDTLHGINTLINKVIPLKPDVVVLMENINDLVVLRTQGTYWYPHSLKSHVQNASTLFTRYELPPNSVAPLTDEAIVEAFTKNLRMFVSICQIQGIKPVLMTQANRVEDDALYHRLNQVIRDMTKAGVMVIDLAQQVPATTEYMYDHYHYTDKGSLLAANIISQQLLLTEPFIAL